jgi:hypothetical protein
MKLGKLITIFKKFILRQFYPTQTLKSCLSEMYFHMIVPSSSHGSTKLLLPWDFPTQLLYAFLISDNFVYSVIYPYLWHALFHAILQISVITVTRLQTQNSILDRGRDSSFLQWVTGIISAGEKRPVHEADHTTPSNKKVKNMWRYRPTSTPPHVSILWCLIQHKDKFIFTCYLQSNHIEDWRWRVRFSERKCNMVRS